VTALLSDIGIAGGCLFIAAVACLVILFSLCVADDRRDGRHAATQPSRVTEVGDDTLTMLSPRDVDAEIEQWLREGGRG
jgi:hypothetical protein